MTKIVSVIPARGGSKGIPRKNMREMGDKPLVAHAIETSKESELIDTVVLTTDSKEIAQIGRQYGVDRVIERPERLATDEVPLAPVVTHAFEEVGGGSRYEYVLCFQPTVPLVEPESVDEGIKTGLDSDGDSVVFVKDSTHLYWKKTDEGHVPVSYDRKNRQQMDPIYGEIGVFLTHRDIVSEGRRVGDAPVFHEVNPAEGIDIDTYSDWLLAESRFGRKSILYRVTGNGDTGTGHVYRGITIADRVFKHDIVFAVEEKDELAIDKLEESNYDYLVFSSEEEFLRHVRSDRPDVVVNDVLDTSAGYMRALDETGSRTVNFEDLGEGTEYADAVINALYEHSNPPENHYFGYRYFCLRNEFRYASQKTEIPSVDRIMISFGGTDENNLTKRTLKAISNLDRSLSLDVVLGLGYTKQETLEDVISDYPPNITVEMSQNISSMAEHMEKADLLITSNGRTVYEAGSLNLPMISVAQNAREQKHPYAHISRGVLSLGQAEFISEDDILTAVKNYIEDDERREAMRRALSKHDIADGVERVKNVIIEQTENQ